MTTKHFSTRLILDFMLSVDLRSKSGSNTRDLAVQNIELMTHLLGEDVRLCDTNHFNKAVDHCRLSLMQQFPALARYSPTFIRNLSQHPSYVGFLAELRGVDSLPPGCFDFGPTAEYVPHIPAYVFAGHPGKHGHLINPIYLAAIERCLGAEIDGHLHDMDVPTSSANNQQEQHVSAA